MFCSYPEVPPPNRDEECNQTPGGACSVPRHARLSPTRPSTQHTEPGRLQTAPRHHPPPRRPAEWPNRLDATRSVWGGEREGNVSVGSYPSALRAGERGGWRRELLLLWQAAVYACDASRGGRPFSSRSFSSPFAVLPAWPPSHTHTFGVPMRAASARDTSQAPRAIGPFLWGGHLQLLPELRNFRLELRHSAAPHFRGNPNKGTGGQERYTGGADKLSASEKKKRQAFGTQATEGLGGYVYNSRNGSPRSHAKTPSMATDHPANSRLSHMAP